MYILLARLSRRENLRLLGREWEEEGGGIYRSSPFLNFPGERELIEMAAFLFVIYFFNDTDDDGEFER